MKSVGVPNEINGWIDFSFHDADCSWQCSPTDCGKRAESLRGAGVNAPHAAVFDDDQVSVGRFAYMNSSIAS
tara:strand:- start:4546 stop:4761 length:216 start_codon:yes stop_codon:yes gene_type:complete